MQSLRCLQDFGWRRRRPHARGRPTRKGRNVDAELVGDGAKVHIASHDHGPAPPLAHKAAPPTNGHGSPACQAKHRPALEVPAAPPKLRAGGSRKWPRCRPCRTALCGEGSVRSWRQSGQCGTLLASAVAKSLPMRDFPRAGDQGADRITPSPRDAAVRRPDRTSGSAHLARSATASPSPRVRYPVRSFAGRRHPLPAPRSPARERTSAGRRR